MGKSRAQTAILPKADRHKRSQSLKAGELISSQLGELSELEYEDFVLPARYWKSTDLESEISTAFLGCPQTSANGMEATTFRS
jgi:hypothetical protein